MSHFTPDFNALNVGQISLSSQIEPVRLIQLWTDQIVQVFHTLVFSDESGGKTQLAARLDLRCDTPEGVCWRHLYFVEYEESP